MSIYVDSINVAHATKTSMNAAPGSGIKYPTNYATFEHLFQTSKTRELITTNDESVTKVLFNTGGSDSSATSPSQQSRDGTGGAVTPMISIGIKSKFNTKTNVKQLLVALNFNSLSLHHLFSSQNDFWIFQLIELFNLVDIEVLGYQVPIVLTELHLNVANSCIVYRPLYLATRALVAFKSLHWSSNVTAESSHTLLVFNIEDIYLFLSKLTTMNVNIACDLSTGDSSTSGINLKRDYVCVASSDLFELRLLINEEINNDKPR